MNENRNLKILSFVIMIILGFVLNIRGTVIPSIKSGLSISYGQIGLMLMLTSLGFMLSTLLGGIASSKYGLKKVVFLGLLLMMTAVFSMIFVSSFLLLLTLMVLLGMGMGYSEIGVNTLGTKIFKNKLGMMMNLLHFFFGVGATISPRITGHLLASDIAWNHIYFYTGGIVVVVFAYLCFTSFPANIEQGEKNNIGYRQIIKDKKVWFLTAILGFSITAESGTANWLVNYLQVEHSFSTVSSSTYLSLFYIIFTLGRLLGSYLTELIGYLKSIAYFAAIAFIIFVCALFLQARGAIFFSITGLFISILFPTVMAIIMQLFKSNTGSYLGFIITGGSAISMTTNWLIGKTTEFMGVYSGFASLAIYILLILLFVFLLNRNVKKAANLPNLWKQAEVPH